jgi:pseudaminic acid synthase
LYDEAHTPWEWHEEIFQLAKELDLIVFSSPFDDTAVDFLESLDCPAYKIASPEIIDIPLIQKVASTGKPVIISTGMATYREIEEAITAASELSPNKIIVLHCTSSYPAVIKDANLATMQSIRENLNVLTGLSDHTTSILTSIVSVGLGACLIEKHFTLSRADGGVDSSFSLEIDELRELIQSVNSAWLALGEPTFSPLESESTVFKNRRSLYAITDISEGEMFTRKNVKSIRPGYGLKPKLLPQVLGQISKRSIKFGEPISQDMLSSKISNDR